LAQQAVELTAGANYVGGDLNVRHLMMQQARSQFQLERSRREKRAGYLLN
jgi:hypothetical protein